MTQIKRDRHKKRGLLRKSQWKQPGGDMMRGRARWEVRQDGGGRVGSTEEEEEEERRHKVEELHMGSSWDWKEEEYTE